MEQVARETLKQAPENPYFHFCLGVALQLQGKEDEGYGKFRWATELDPSYSQDYFKMGLIMAHRDRIDKAIALYEKALSIDTELPEATFNLGNLLFRKGKRKKGAALVKRSEALFAKIGNKAMVNLACKTFQQMEEYLATAEVMDILKRMKEQPRKTGKKRKKPKKK